MRWTASGGQAILTFRSLAINDQFNEAWYKMMKIEEEKRVSKWEMAA
jgi:hypothetical protein